MIDLWMSMSGMVYVLCTLKDSLNVVISFRAMYNLTMLATPHLISSKGNVVNVSSVNGMRSVSNWQSFWDVAFKFVINFICSFLDSWLTTFPKPLLINSLVAWPLNLLLSKSGSILSSEIVGFFSFFWSIVQSELSIPKKLGDFLISSDIQHFRYGESAPFVT